MVWLAPQFRSRGGRSALSRISGTPASLASITAGYQCAGALPDVASSATGRPEARATPRAKNAALRSSRMGTMSTSSRRWAASTTGVEREPGDSTSVVIPAAARPSSNASHQRRLRQPVSTASRPWLPDRGGVLIRPSSAGSCAAAEVPRPLERPAVLWQRFAAAIGNGRQRRRIAIANRSHGEVFVGAAAAAMPCCTGGAGALRLQIAPTGRQVTVGAACSRDADLQAAPARRDCKSLPQPPRVSACSPRSTRQIRIGCASFGGFQGGLHDLSGVLQRSEHGLELGLGLVPFGDGIRTSNDAAARVEFGAVGADAGTAKQHP